MWKSIRWPTYILTAALFLAACDDAADREAKYLERGKTLFESGNLVKARLEFRNVLQINPKSAEALYYIGLISKEGDDFRSAFGLFQRAIQEDPKHLAARVQLGRFYILANKQDEASEQIEAILAIEPDNRDAKILKATSLLSRGELESAAELSRAILVEVPNHEQAAPLYARTLSRLGRPGEALSILEDAISAHPQNTRLLRLKIQFHLEADELTEAETTYRLLVERSDELAVRTDMAWFLIRQDRLDDAEELLRSVVAGRPDSLGAQKLLIDFLLNHRGFEAAEEQLLAYIAEGSQKSAHQFGLAAIYRDNDRLDDAKDVYTDIIEGAGSAPDGIVARSALARLLLEQDRIDDATKLVDEVLAVDPGNGTALLLRGQILYAQDQFDSAVTDLRTVLRDDPSEATALDLLAQAHLRSGQRDLAMDALRNLYSLQPQNVKVMVALARLNVLNGNLTEAERWLKESEEVSPGNAEIARIRISYHLAGQDFDSAAEEARELIRVPALEAYGRLVLGRIYLGKAEYGAALEQFERVLDIDPSSNEAIGGVVRTLMSAGRIDEAEAKLQKRVDDRPDDANSLNLLGVLYSAAGRDRIMFESIFRNAAEMETGWHAPLLNLGSALSERGLYGEALIVLREALERFPQGADINMVLGVTYQRAGDVRSAIATYEAMHNLGQGGNTVANNLAALIADHQYKDPARLEYAYQVAVPFRDSERPEQLDTLGWVHYRLGNLIEAERYVGAALEKGLSTPEAYYHIGMIHASLGKNESAREYLEKATAPDSEPFPGQSAAAERLKDL